VRRQRSSSAKGSDFFQILIETAKLQLSSLSFYQAILAEFIGVFIITMFISGFGLNFNRVASSSVPSSSPVGATSNSSGGGNAQLAAVVEYEFEITPSINGAIGTGLILATMVWSTNCVSGANLNPAISIVLIFTNDLDMMRGIFYIIFQLLGAYAGAATLYGLVPSHARAQLGLTLVNDKVTLLKAFGVEVLITFLLAFAIFACLDKNRKDLGGSFPLTIGFAATCGILFGVYTLCFVYYFFK
jgi:glycerol uptake facilitator-like aquaporin